ncbi:MAG: hypothetical protein ACOC5H_02785 [Desulfovermiculus sp.]
MVWIVTALCCICAVELLLRAGLFATIRQMRAVYGKTVRTLTNKRISDHWKEKVLPAYAWMIFKGSVWLLLSLLLVFGPFLIAIFLAESFDLGFLSFVSSWTGIIGATCIAAAYGLVRGRYGKK